jgi:eukaryotic-like serine/threonine-protein kinase
MAFGCDDATAPRETAAGAFDSDLQARLGFEHGDRLADRYRIVRLLGRGAMGAVYEAVDELRAGLRVAVKLLIPRQPHALYRLKNEFRGLAETVHPNLVGLHGLGVDPLGWFIVMDLVDPSTDFLSYVRAREHGGFDEARLRSALTQLVRGISAIHAAGKVHRDLKPGNVLVTREGRVVIVDFGLVGDLDASNVVRTTEDVFAGTPAYAAPEQLHGKGLGPKADLYAVGAMLYEALTGKLPIEAKSIPRLLERKAREPVPRASAVANCIPPDLDALCSALLQTDSQLRPDVREVLHRLGEQPRMPAEALSALPFVARESELRVLREAAVRARNDAAPVMVLLSGPSGIGKSALVSRFLELAGHETGALTFKGRCHAQEQLPYKAFDTLIDALGRYLIGLPAVSAASLMPREVSLLSRLFPTLSRVPAVVHMPAGRCPVLDEALLRSRAFSALKELLARIADRETLSLCFDDLQWSDEDSIELLRELLRGPDAPACLFLCVFRENEPGESTLGDALRALPGVQRIEVKLEPLDPRASVELAHAMLGDAGTEADLGFVVSEAAGSPFLLKELSREARARGRVSGIHETVAGRIAQLDAGAKSLLELVCIAGQPLEVGIASAASQVGPQALPSVLASTLVRTNVRDDREYLESYHDRIREAVVAGIEPERRARLHEKLAHAFARSQHPDPDLVARHYRCAGLPLRAAPYTLAAAEQASRGLAFGRAVELYELALEDADEAVKPRVELALADAHANMGRLTRAAELYERVAIGSQSIAERRDLTSKAMVLHLLVGNVKRGSHLLDALCKELGIMPMPRRRWLASLSIVFLAFYYLLGRRITSLPVPTQSRHTLLSRQRMELCGRAARGFVHWSLDHGLYFSLKFALDTRRYRDPVKWPIAMAWDTTVRSIRKGVSSQQDERIMADAIALAEEQGEEVHAIVLSVAGNRCVHVGRYAEGLEFLERSEQVLLARGRSMAPLFNGARSRRYVAWIASGQMHQILSHSAAWLAEARALGDQWGELIVQLMGSVRFLALDDPDAARESVAILDSRLGKASAFCAEAGWRGEPALYEGEVDGAIAACEAARRSPWFHSQQRFAHDRTWCSLFRARAYLAVAARTNASVYLRMAEREVRRLARERFAMAPAAAAQVRGTLAMLRGNEQLALSELERAADVYAKAGIMLYAAAVRDRLGKLKKGEQGTELVTEARLTALTLGVRNPDRWFRSLVPGFED